MSFTHNIKSLFQPLNVVDTEFDYQAPLRPHGNTGVKGVLEDYKEAKRKMVFIGLFNKQKQMNNLISRSLEENMKTKS